MKKLVIMVLTAMGLASGLAAPAGADIWHCPSSPTFSDVPANHAFFCQIEWMFEYDIADGYADGTFRPANNLTRQGLAGWFYNFADYVDDDTLPFIPPTLPTFSDVPTTHPFYVQIEWMADQGLVNGYPDGTFRPTVTVSRQAMAAVLYRYTGESDPFFTPPAVPTFSDVPTTHPFYDEIEWLAYQGITEGYPDGTYRPGNAVTRQAGAAFIFWDYWSYV